MEPATATETAGARTENWMQKSVGTKPTQKDQDFWTEKQGGRLARLPLKMKWSCFLGLAFYESNSSGL